jgi:hypothetical protein
VVSTQSTTRYIGQVFFFFFFFPKHAAATRKVGSEGQRHSNGGGTHSSKQGGGWADDRWRGESHGRKIRWEGDQVGGSDGLNGRKDLTQSPKAPARVTQSGVGMYRAVVF